MDSTESVIGTRISGDEKDVCEASLSVQFKKPKHANKILIPCSSFAVLALLRSLRKTF